MGIRTDCAVIRKCDDFSECVDLGESSPEERAHRVALELRDLAIRLARKFSPAPRHAALDPDDLAQEAHLAFYEAALECPDPTAETFPSFAAMRAAWRFRTIIPENQYPVVVRKAQVGNTKNPAAVMATAPRVGSGPILDNVTASPCDESSGRTTPSDRLRPLLGVLTDHQRRVVSLAYGVDGPALPKSEIADVLGRSESAVWGCLTIATDKLRGAAGFSRKVGSAARRRAAAEKQAARHSLPELAI